LTAILRPQEKPLLNRRWYPLSPLWQGDETDVKQGLPHGQLAPPYYGHSPELEIAFGEKGTFWGRHYLFWHARQPLTLIYEVFSPCLRKYLGEMRIDQLST
jgi:hypothetical protein